MQIILDPPIPQKIQKMKERVRWQHPSIVRRGIDQTSIVLDDGNSDSPKFSFMVLGDSGTSVHHGHDPQRQIAELMLEHGHRCSFALHTGDVIYTVGSREYYSENFIEPYREFLENGFKSNRIRYDSMIFKLPILPVLGNHDYYDVPLMCRLLAGATLPLRRLLGYRKLEIGWHGSDCGDAYARAFLDYLQAIAPIDLEHHLDCHYTAKTDTGRCLRYEPKHFTRLPNRYYTFRYGGIDFFALDSNTFNAPSPLPATPEGITLRRELEKRRHEIEIEELQILARTNFNSGTPEEAEKLDALQAKLNQIDEIKIDIEKQLEHHNAIDFEQLDWLQSRLIESWNTEEVRGRIVYFHHPPYVTEATKWYQAQTLAVRYRLRACFDRVAETLGSATQGRPIVDLILNGHAHCLEHLRTTNTGHADSGINCIISGGSGYYPRRQREEGSELLETLGRSTRKVADSILFVGRNGYDELERLPYSFVRIDVDEKFPAKFIVNPYIAERFQGKWYNYQLEPFAIGGGVKN